MTLSLSQRVNSDNYFLTAKIIFYKILKYCQKYNSDTSISDNFIIVKKG